MTAFIVAFTTAIAGERSKQLNFEDEVIEGVNRQSAESLTELSEKEDRKTKGHLYEKRLKFTEENQETLRELTLGQQ